MVAGFMNEMQRATARLATRLQSRAGVNVIYQRGGGSAGECSVPLVAIPGKEGGGASSPGAATIARYEHTERDWLIAVAELAFEGVPTEPVRGDRIIEIDGPKSSWEVLPRDAEKDWRFTDETGQIYRVHCVLVRGDD
jgi:hypothetical protein